MRVLAALPDSTLPSTPSCHPEAHCALVAPRGQRRRGRRVPLAARRGEVLRRRRGLGSGGPWATHAVAAGRVSTLPWVRCLLLQLGGRLSHSRTNKQRPRASPGTLSGIPYTLPETESRFPGNRTGKASLMTEVSLPGCVLHSRSSAVTFLACDSDTHYFMHLHRGILRRENEVIPTTYFPEHGMARSACSQVTWN